MQREWKIFIRIPANPTLEDIEIAVKNGMGMKRDVEKQSWGVDYRDAR